MEYSTRPVKIVTTETPAKAAAIEAPIGTDDDEEVLSAAGFSTEVDDFQRRSNVDRADRANSLFLVRRDCMLAGVGGGKWDNKNKKKPVWNVVPRGVGRF